MNVTQKIIHEIKTVTAVTIYFCCWLGILLLIKHLLLAEYKIVFVDYSIALIGALVLAKVVLVLECAPLGAWVQARPAWVDVLLRTVLYAFGVFVVLLLEKTFHAHDHYGSFGAALEAVIQHADMNHVWLNTLCLSGALLSYNILSVLRRSLGKGALVKILLNPLPADPAEKSASKANVS